LDEATLNGKDIEVPQCLQMIAVIRWSTWKYWIQSTDQRGDGEVTSAKSKSSTSQKEESHAHMDGHIVAIV
jgi:hypothetical protein